jgi:hypothetical protein
VPSAGFSLSVPVNHPVKETNMGKIAEARKNSKRTKQTATVLVLTNSGFSDERAELTTKLEAARNAPKDDRLGQKSVVEKLSAELAKLNDEESGELRKLEFTRVPSHVWNDVTSAHPSRTIKDEEGVVIGVLETDSTFGFNFNAACREVAMHYSQACEVAEDGTKEPLDDEDWEAIWDDISGIEEQNIVNAILQLNLFGPTMERSRLKKASATTGVSDET